MFQDKWYRQKNGVPTGGTLCVQLANIAVYYVLSNKVYNNPDLMRNIISSKRYIDDGSGLFRGTKRMFSEWITQVNTEIGTYGLFIDEYSISPPGEYVSFLDINFCIDKFGHLQTDLYVKPTDARSYLYFGSSHPNHVFSGIVFSGCLRLRRIINCNERLAKQLEVLKTCFLECNYPKRMVNNIVEKVKGLNRTLVKKQPPPDPTPSTEIRVISTFEGDSPLVEVTEAHTSTLSLTRSFSSSSTASFAGPPKKANVFGYVKRTGPGLL